MLALILLAGGFAVPAKPVRPCKVVHPTQTLVFAEDGTFTTYAAPYARPTSAWLRNLPECSRAGEGKGGQKPAKAIK